MPRIPVSVLITDLDNTLFDWVEIWYETFGAMLRRVSEKSEISEEKLKSEIRAIHRKHGTSEYAFVLEEIPSLRKKHPKENIIEIYGDAINEFREQRRKYLRLFPSVYNTLSTVKDSGALVIGYTESMAYYSNYRVRKLKLDGLIDFIYSPADHDLPKGLSREQIRRYPAEQYELKYTVHRHTPAGELKPNPEVLLDIIQNTGADRTQCVYVGDSLFKDVAMAQDAGVLDAYALYGKAQDRSEYELLREVTHWTDEDVEREKRISKRDVQPTFTLEKSFAEILSLFKFQRHKADPLNVKEVIDVWKKVVDVQQHFNDIEMRIRNMYVMLILALAAAFGFLLEKKFSITSHGIEVKYIVILPLVGVLISYLFYFMDRHWYHRLLLGAVGLGAKIENTYSEVLPEIALTNSIGNKSAVEVRNPIMKLLVWLVVTDKRSRGSGALHSDGKIELFYKPVIWLLALITLGALLFDGVLVDGASLWDHLSKLSGRGLRPPH